MIKRITISLIVVCAATWSSGQTNIFYDNFDTYAVGASLAATNPQWTTWSGATGGTEDVKVSDERSFSAPHSIKFFSQSIQGNEDMVLKLNNKTSGKYEVTFKIYIDTLASAGGYFNMLQALPPNEQWAFSLTFLPSAELGFNHANTPVIVGNYVKGTWLSVKIIVNLDVDSAALYLEDALLTTWKWSIDENGDQGLTQLAGLDFFAYSGGVAGYSVHYYIDDVNFMEIGSIGVKTILPVRNMVSFPNPALDRVSFNAPGAKELQIFSVNGALAGCIPVENGEASIGHLVSGVYIGRLITPSAVYTTRIVKQ